MDSFCIFQEQQAILCLARENGNEQHVVLRSSHSSREETNRLANTFTASVKCLSNKSMCSQESGGIEMEEEGRKYVKM